MEHIIPFTGVRIYIYKYMGVCGTTVGSCFDDSLIASQQRCDCTVQLTGLPVHIVVERIGFEIGIVFLTAQQRSLD